MATIPQTRVSTPTVDGFISVCKGFNLFKPGQGLDYAVEWNRMLLDVDPTVLAWKLHLRTGAGLYAGICGPAYAADITLSNGLADGQTVSFDTSLSEILAGFEMGIGVRFMLYLDMQQWTVDAHWVSDGWSSHLQVDTYWQEVGQIGLDITLDLIQLLVYYALALPGLVAPARFPTGSGLAMIAKNLNNLAKQGSASVEPTFYFIINIIDQVPGYKTLATLLSKIGGFLQFGPDFVLSAPTTVSVVKAATDGAEYGVQTADFHMTGTRSGTSTVGASTLQLTLEHTSSIRIGIGLGLCLTVLKILSIGYTTGPLLDILSLLGLTPTFGPFDNTIQAAYGASAPPARAARGAPGCCYEVVLDAPAVSPV